MGEAKAATFADEVKAAEELNAIIREIHGEGKKALLWVARGIKIGVETAQGVQITAVV